jgi:tRNA G37 N-methylase Trm5
MKDWKPAPNIVVVGAAEGYYAIGMKCRLPKAKVYAIEPSNESISILMNAAAANQAEIIVGAPLGEVFAAPDLVLMDCEGAEVEYLDYEKFPMLASAHVIVEIHNLQGQNTDGILLDRFRGTHRVVMYMEGPRDPNRFACLSGMTSDYRWMAVSEGRPCLMSWYSMTPKGVLVS